MSFRKFGGLQYSAKHNSVSSYYNTSNNLQVTTIGQPNTYIVVESGLTGNINTNTVPDNAWIEAAIQAAVKEALKGLTPTEIISHAGPTGPQGPPGPYGSVGSQGIQGPTGLEGSKGIEGPTGSRGLEGPTGSQGIQGIQGIQGLQGPQGVPGPAGPTNSTTGDASTIFTLKDARKSIDIIGPLILQASADGTITVPTSYSRDVPNIIDIVSVFVGTDVNRIEAVAFYNATSLTSITIPNTVTSIGGSAFNGATSLTSITIPSSVMFIGDLAFYGASKLSSINVPASVRSIGADAFANAASLTSINVDNSNPFYSSVSGVLFYKNDPLPQYPNGNTTLLQYPNGNTQTSYSIPDNVTKIGDSAFGYTTYLTHITMIPNSVTSIGSGAFTGSGVKFVVFESSVNLKGLYLSIGSNQSFFNTKGVTISVVGQTDFTIVDGNPNVNYTQGIDISGNLTPTSYTNTTAVNNMKITLDNIQKVVVGTNVSSIVASAFQNAKILQSITIPNTVTSIGYLAFKNIIKLTEIKVHTDNSKYLSDSGVLFNKEKTTLIQYPIEKDQTSYIIPNTVTSISNYAFQYATILQSIEIPASVKSIGNNAFEIANKLTTVKFAQDSQLQSIGANAFYRTGLSSIEIPNKVTSIGDNAFWNANKLTTVTFANPSQLQSIGIYAFAYDASLSSIEIPASVTNIGNSAFEEATNLKTVTFAQQDSQLTSIGARAFFKATSLSSITIPNTVTEIGDNAFSNASKLDTVKFAQDSKLGGIGNYVFYQATSLSSIMIPASVTRIGDYAFYQASGLTTVTFAQDSQLTSIGDNAFFGVTKLTSIEIPASVTSIGKYAFGFSSPGINGDSSLTTVTFAPNSKLASIGETAFQGAIRLSKIIIPNSVTSIGLEAFKNTPMLSSITIPSSVKSIGKDAFSSLALKTVFFESSNSLTTFNVSIGPGKSFFGAPNVTISVIGQTEFTLTTGTIFGVDIRGVLTVATSVPLIDINKVSVGTYVTSIGANAFQGANSLTSITIPNTVTSISDYAFYKAPSLTTVTFASDSTLNSIGESAFYNAINLRSIEVPASVTSIGDSAFAEMTGLTKVTFAEGSRLTNIGSNAFYNAKGLTSITIPAFVANIGNFAFSGIINLTSITIPVSVTYIGLNAFSGSGLKTVVFDSITNYNSLSISNGFKLTSNQTFFGAQGVTISVQNQITFTLTDGTIVFLTLSGGLTSSSYGNIIPSKIKSIAIGATFTSIGNQAFQGATALTSVTFDQDSQLASIGDQAFQGATSLQSIKIPTSVTSIASNAFSQSGLKTVIFESSSKLATLNVSIGTNKTFFGATGVTISVGQTDFTLKDGTITRVDIQGILTPQSYTSKNINLLDIVSVSVGTNVTSIGSGAFPTPSAPLKSITIPASVTSIGDNAFNNVSALTTVTFAPDSQLTLIKNNAFSGSGITSIIIPASVESIGNEAFGYAYKLTNVTFATGSKPLSIGERAFKRTTILKSITIPALVTSIGNNAFFESGLTTVTFVTKTNLGSLGATNGFTIGSGQTFFGATNVTISALDYVAKANDTTYYYPGVTKSPIDIDTTGYNRCDVLVVGGGGKAGKSWDASGYYFGFGGAGGGGGSASFTNILCNPIDGNIQFKVLQVNNGKLEPEWFLSGWTQNGSSLGDCSLQAQNGRNGSDSSISSSQWTMGGGGPGGTAGGKMGLLSSSVTLTTNTGKDGSKLANPIMSYYLPSIPDGLIGGAPGTILTPPFKAPTTNSGKGSRNQEFMKASYNPGNNTYKYYDIVGDPPGAAYIQVNLYNAR